MRGLFVISGCILVVATGTVWAQSLSAPPTSVRQVGVYECPNHPQIQATWPARCSICPAVLNCVPPSGTMVAGLTAVANRQQQAQQRAEEWRQRYRRYGYAYPQYMHPYPPPGYRYYPTQGYYYSRITGLYYFPESGYYYSPKTGQYYFYNVHTGRYYPALPGYEYYQRYGY
jgi:hypothetical protein